MCGIAGVIDSRNNINKEKFEKMVDIISHRGPDDRGTFFDDKIALGHRRLSIIDLSKDGHQPYIYQNRYVAVYNGEIYNYEELRSELETRGYNFISKTDTEVLVAMYDYYGEKCVDKLNGMWAFAIYDKDEQAIFCSRDRFGIKPFYYYWDNGTLMFASEIKQILLMLENEIYANKQRLLEFLILGDLDYTDETMFKDIKQLKGGYNLSYKIKTSEIFVSEYYKLPTEVNRRSSYQEQCKIFKEKFTNSIERHLRADVPIGYCLSGGLDSSAIVCMADTILKKTKKHSKQYAVSSCFEDKRYDERVYIDEVISETDVTSIKVFPEEENLFAKLDKIIWHMDEPFDSTSVYAQWNIFAAASENGLTVMLDGQGADEQLAGYTGFYTVLFAYYLRRFSFFKLARELYSYRRLRSVTEKHISMNSIILNAVLSAYIPERIKLDIKRKLSYRNVDLPFDNELIDKVLENRYIYPVHSPQQYIRDSIRFGMSTLLHYEDRNSMAHSIESRVPFLDYELVESIYRMPFEYKIRKGITKAVMRDGLEGVLPEKIRKRYNKLGFVTPEDQWINHNVEFFEAELEKTCDSLANLISKEKVMEWYHAKAGNIPRGNSLVWRIICAGHWMKVFNVHL